MWIRLWVWLRSDLRRYIIGYGCSQNAGTSKHILEMTSGVRVQRDNRSSNNVFFAHLDVVTRHLSDFPAQWFTTSKFSCSDTSNPNHERHDKWPHDSNQVCHGNPWLSVLIKPRSIYIKHSGYLVIGQRRVKNDDGLQLRTQDCKTDGDSDKLRRMNTAPCVSQACWVLDEMFEAPTEPGFPKKINKRTRNVRGACRKWFLNVCKVGNRLIRTWLCNSLGQLLFCKAIRRRLWG